MHYVGKSFQIWSTSKEAQEKYQANWDSVFGPKPSETDPESSSVCDTPECTACAKVSRNRKKNGEI